jgi:hypothetical protein
MTRGAYESPPLSRRWQDGRRAGTWVAKAQATLIPSEMKGALDRMRSAVGFALKGGRALLRAAAEKPGLP